MPAFQYQALDANGRRQRGIEQGDHPRQVRQQLRKRGWIPLEVAEIHQRNKQRSPRLGQRRTRLSASELALATRQLATMLRAALPVEESLQAVAEQSETARVKRVFAAARAQVVAGNTLAQALAQFPRVFPADYRATVAAGEQSGDLAAVLERLADHTEHNQEFRQQLTTALVYPIILAVVAAGVIVALLTYVVPQVVDVFASIDQELPGLTRGLIATSDFLSAQGVWLLVALVSVVVLFRWALRKPGFRRRFDRALLATPGIRKLVRSANSARFCRTLATLISAGVSMLEALAISAQVVRSVPIGEAIGQASAQVREGASLSRSLAASSYLPPLTVHLIASGESSGRLGEMLERAANAQEKELQAFISTFLSLLEPLMILVMGGLVLVIVLAIMLPIFNLNQLVA